MDIKATNGLRHTIFSRNSIYSPLCAVTGKCLVIGSRYLSLFALPLFFLLVFRDRERVSLDRRQYFDIPDVSPPPPPLSSISDLASHARATERPHLDKCPLLLSPEFRFSHRIPQGTLKRKKEEKGNKCQSGLFWAWRVGEGGWIKILEFPARFAAKSDKPVCFPPLLLLLLR